MKIYKYILAFLVITACQPISNPNQLETWKKEIVDTERAFAEMVKNEGIQKGFTHFAAPNAVIKRNGKLVISPDSISQWYGDRPNPNTELSWEPSYVDVASSGDLGYTYGPYVFKRTDSLGNVTENTGFFHTVWKRQPDGSWKYVWD